MTALFTKLLEALELGEATVLCTVIAGSGSIPRGAGAQMLAGRNGLLCGTIGGGSVEAQAIALCRELIVQHQTSHIHEYLLHQNEKEDIGMVCGGRVTVHFQFVDPQNPAWQTLVRNILQQINLRQPASFVLSLAGDEMPTLSPPNIPVSAEHYAIPLPIGERAILFGAGHCSVALSPILQSVGFRVIVIDDRPELADPVRFPGADAVICGEYTHLQEYLTLTDADYFVVMTHGHEHDFTVESQLLRLPCAYLGVIGSRRKTAAVNARLLEAGICEEAIATVHAPIGTAIKAVTPEEIAVSIAGEMIFVRAERREKQCQVPHSCPMHE